MPELGWWIEDQPHLVLAFHIGVIALTAASVAFSVRSLLRARRDSPIRWWRLGRSIVVGSLSALVGLMFVGGLVKIGPRLLHHARTLGEDGSRLRMRRLEDDAPASVAAAGHSVTVVSLWATWCRPCVEEFEFLDRLERDYAGKNVRFVHISQEDPQTLREFVRTHPGAEFGTLHGYADAGTWWPVTRLPTTLVIDAEGKVTRMLQGSASYERLVYAIDRTLDSE